jgi:hypothetical protein
MASYELAIKMGADFIECDVVLTKDLVPVRAAARLLTTPRRTSRARPARGGAALDPCPHHSHINTIGKRQAATQCILPSPPQICRHEPLLSGTTDADAKVPTRAPPALPLVSQHPRVAPLRSCRPCSPALNLVRAFPPCLCPTVPPVHHQQDYRRLQLHRRLLHRPHVRADQDAARRAALGGAQPELQRHVWGETRTAM